MGTVTIDGTNFTTYGTSPLNEADSYIKGTVGKGADAWRALDDDDAKGRLIVQAFRYLERKRWQGDKTDDAQATQWPRSGVVDGDGNEVADDEVPQLIIDAQYELAAIFLGDQAAASAASTGSNIKRVNAKGVEVEFFKATDVSASATKLPTSVQEMVGCFLSSAVGNSSAAVAYNRRDGWDDCQTSSFDDCATLDRTEPF